MKSGLQSVNYTVAAGLGGNARAVSASGGPVQGHFAVYITQAPPPTQVNPEYRPGGARNLPVDSPASPEAPDQGRTRRKPLGQRAGAHALAARPRAGLGVLARCRKIHTPISPDGDAFWWRWHYDCLRPFRARRAPAREARSGSPGACAGTACAPHILQEESIPLMPPRTRQQNVTAAQWSPNGTALGSPDLTVSGNQVFGANVFSSAVQRHRLPKHVYKALQRTLASGEALDTSLADAVALAMKDWAMEKGATHYTHWFQPLTGSTAEKHDSFYGPDGRGHGARGILRQGAHPGRARRLLVPDRRHPRHLRGARLHRLGPHLARRSSSRTPTARCCASRPPSPPGPGEALDNKIPLLRSMDALSDAAVDGARAARRRRRRAGLHDDRLRAGVLPDRRAVLLRTARPA